MKIFEMCLAIYSAVSVIVAMWTVFALHFTAVKTWFPYKSVLFRFCFDCVLFLFTVVFWQFILGYIIGDFIRLINQEPDYHD